MIGITKLLCGSEHFGDSLRYTHGAKDAQWGVSRELGPVVVWNCTNTCNLKCKHCYADSKPEQFKEELDTEEAKALIDDLASLKVPVLLISGGEPLLRKDLFELLEYTREKNIRTTVSTNGTLIDKETAKHLKQRGVSYVGISLDGLGVNNDIFRGVQGSFDKAADGIRNCLDIGQKVGLRFTINRSNYDQLEDIFYFIKEEGIPRVCFYHLAYSGRGSKMIEEDITPEEKRLAMDLIMKKALKLRDKVEILTVDNHADAAYLYLQVKKNHPELAHKVSKLLTMNGGNRSGMAFANIDYKGSVHPDQFTQHHHFGNVRERKFSEIWHSPENALAMSLRDRKKLLRGRCSQCKWLDICNGNLRVRAEAVTGDFWASDPACYLTDEEIRR
ncbi:putative heme d1 biosynthesis radical SAM protein NirJ1 [Cellulosilyticum sp. I15G10I2]|uniref:putative heme d1 biosynthesis radical SAM protein NirJ1 n=1 Tax=Cellulosilyticum sp. I15G10I2 TaxID=1892843 RepID=UPI00085C01E9|nr:putative heme d1 biosynthesis radical SAM protein NirJ1 [Cellulosilyticum sp. I15G10I2]